MSIAEKLTTMAENVPKVYEAGQKSMVDESKVIEKTVTGFDYICVDDVSEIPHEATLIIDDNHIGEVAPSINVTITDGVVTQIEALEDEYPNPTTKIVGVKIDGTIVVEATNTGITMGLYSTPFKLTNDYKEIRFGLNGKHKDTIVSIDPTRLEVGQCYILSVNFTNITQGTISWQDMSIVRASAEDETIPLINDFSQIKVSCYAEKYTNGTFSTEPTIYNVSSNGVVEGIKSSCPAMTLISDTSELMYSLNYHQSWGKKVEHDATWDGIQLDGARTNYSYGFYNWQPQAFRPKYDLVPTNASNMFASFNGRAGSTYADLAKLLDDAGVKLDTSKCTNFTNMLYFARVSRVPELDTRAASSLNDMFGDAQFLETIDKLILKDDGSQTFNYGTSYNNTFWRCYNLKNLIIEGVIGSSLNLQYSTKLSRASTDSILGHLADVDTGISGKTLILPQAAVDAAYPGGSWDDDFGLITSVITNWTFVLV